MAAISEILQSATSYFSINEAIKIYQPLGIFVIGMIIYSIFIFKFYRFVARRDIFKYTEHRKDGTGKTPFQKFLSNLGYMLKKDPPLHAGRILLHRYLEPLNISVTKMAEILGVSRKTISNIIN